MLVMDAINRQLAHYPCHVGQIIYIAKIIKDGGWRTLSIAEDASQQYNPPAFCKKIILSALLFETI
jgi:hypothetical protein